MTIRSASLLLLLCLAAMLAGPAAAHEVPDSVRLQLFLKPEGDRLRLLVRAPLAAMQEVDVPQRGPGYVDLARVEPALRHAALLWIADNLTVMAGGEELPAPQLTEARISLPSDRSFAAYDTALALVTGPRLPASMDLYWNQGLLDLLFDYPLADAQAPLAIEPRFARLGIRTQTILHFLPAGGSERAFDFHGNPGLLHLDPRWLQAAWQFVQSGFRHILAGTDHLLFIACLVIPLRRFRILALIVTAFTLAHSITLIAAAFGLAPGALWFPPLVELLIAASIVFMALENIAGGRLERRWAIAFLFGLVHGFGFSFALQETLQFAGSHLLTALLAFNLGVELGQLLVLALLIPALSMLFRHVVAERIGIIILSALIAHTAWHWMSDRADLLARFPVPSLDAATAAGAMRWAMGLLMLAATLWLAGGFGRRDAGKLRTRRD